MLQKAPKEKPARDTPVAYALEPATLSMINGADVLRNVRGTLRPDAVSIAVQLLTVAQ
jgi:hypothetical protein